jgi:hypothetical protein
VGSIPPPFSATMVFQPITVCSGSVSHCPHSSVLVWGSSSSLCRAQSTRCSIADAFCDAKYRVCWNPSLHHQHQVSIRLAGYYGYSDTWAFVIENLPTSCSHVDYIVEYINHVTTRLVLHQLATKPIELPSCIQNVIEWPSRRTCSQVSCVNHEVSASQ